MLFVNRPSTPRRDGQETKDIMLSCRHQFFTGNATVETYAFASKAKTGRDPDRLEVDTRTLSRLMRSCKLFNAEIMPLLFDQAMLSLEINNLYSRLDTKYFSQVLTACLPLKRMRTLTLKMASQNHYLNTYSTLQDYVNTLHCVQKCVPELRTLLIMLPTTENKEKLVTRLEIKSFEYDLTTEAELWVEVIFGMKKLNMLAVGATDCGIEQMLVDHRGVVEEDQLKEKVINCLVGQFRKWCIEGEGLMGVESHVRFLQ